MRWLTGIALALVVVVIATASALAWVLGTQAGARWAIARAESAAAGTLAVEGASGVLAGEMSIERLVVDNAAWHVEARHVRLSADLIAALGGRLHIEPLHAESVDIELRESAKSEPPAVPRLPIAVSIEDVAISRLQLRRESERHVLQDVRLSHARVEPAAGMALSAAGVFSREDENYPAQVRFALDGTPQRLELSTELDIAGVAAKAHALLRPFEEQRIESLTASAGPVDLSRFDATLPRTALSARVQAKATASGLLAGTVSASNPLSGPLDKERIPIAGVEARFSRADLAGARLEDLRITLGGGGSLAGSGTLQIDPLRAELELKASAIDLRRLHSTLRHTALRGPLRLSLAPERQRVAGKLMQDDISVAAELERAGDSLEVRELHAAAGGGKLSGTGRVRLNDTLTFEARLALAGFNPSAFGDYPEGSLNATVEAKGRLRGERAVDAAWNVNDSTLLGRALESRGSARLNMDRVSRAQARASFGSSTASVRGAFGRSGDELAWQLEAPRLAELSPAIEGRLKASGTLSGPWSDPRASGSAQAAEVRLPGGVRARSLSAKFSGTVSSHEATVFAKAPDIALQARLRGGWSPGQGWSGQLLSLTNAGLYPLELKAPAPLHISSEQVEVGRLDARLGKGNLLISGARWSDGELRSSGEVTGLPAQWLLAAAGRSEQVRTNLLLDGSWALAAAPRLQGTIEIRRASGDVSIQGHKLDLRSASLEGKFTDGTLAVRGSLASGLGTLELEGKVAPAQDAEGLGFGPSSAIALRAKADFVTLRELTQPLFEGARLDGRLSAQITATGTLGEPSLQGKLLGEAIRFEMPQYGVYLKNGKLRAALEGESLRVSELSIESGEGSFTATGTLPLRGAGGAAALDWQANKLAILERPNMRLVASGKGELKFDRKRVALTGDLRADRGYLELERERLPQLGEDVVIVGRPRAERDKAARLPVPVDLDIFLDLGDDLAVRAQGFEGELAGRVQLQTNKDGQLRAYGRVYAVNATFQAYGQRLQVDPGVLIFDGPIDNPSLQITAWRRNQAVEAGVQVSGTARAPRVQVVSQPPVPEGERLSWLVLGRAPSDATQADLGLLQAAAGALLSRGETMPLDRKIARAVGLDEVSLRGSGEVQDRVVAFGKRLSDRLYISYEQGLGTVASNLVKLDLSLSQRWSLRAETGTSSGWGLFYRYSWD